MISSTLFSSTRRDFVKAIALGGAGLGVSLPLFSQRAPALLQATPVAENLVMITGAGGTVMLVKGADGLALVDGGLPDRSADLLKLVAEQGGGQKVQFLFNTHWHLDHTGSNEALGASGAKIVAHANTKKWLSTKVFVEAQNRTYERRPPEAIPSNVFYTGVQKMTFGKTAIEYGHLPFAHTDGDIYVFFPEPNILMVSDALSVGRYPIMDYSTGGWIGGMEEATAALLKIGDAKTRIVPGSGPLQIRDDIQAEHDMVGEVKTRVMALIRQGKTLEEVAAAAPTKEFDEKWGKPDLFVTMTYKGLFRNLHEIGGIL